jgi:protein-L-isoaspartate O-methyltransferase
MLLEPKKIIPLLNIQYGMHVLDIGSSIGFWAKPIAELVGTSGSVFAVDNHQEKIDRLHHDVAHAHMDQIHPICADLDAIDTWYLKKDFFHRIIFINMMQDTDQNTGKIIEQLMEFLCIGGELVIIDGAHHQQMIKGIVESFQKNYTVQDIDEVVLRTDHHFFGVRIIK